MARDRPSYDKNHKIRWKHMGSKLIVVDFKRLKSASST